MDRLINYPGAIPLDTDLLQSNKNTMIALGMALQAVLGSSTLVDGLACTPTGPASLQVYVGAGSIYSLSNVDATAYGSLAADMTHQIVKQGINLGTLTLNCPAPVTSGYSVVYLIEAAYADLDGSPVVLPYYNASSPSVAYSGPNNTGVGQNTLRQGQCVVQVKAGIAAPTGSQLVPAVDAGYTALYQVTVANGQTQITSPNIVAVSGAPFISEKLAAKISQTFADARYATQSGLQGCSYNSAAAGGTADALTASYAPTITALANGMTLFVRAGFANATTTPTFTPNSGTIAVKTIVKGNNLPLVATDIAGAGHWIELKYDATYDKWVMQNPSTGLTVVSVASIQSTSKNLVGTWVSNTTSTWTADQITLQNGGNQPYLATAFNATLNTALTGVVNGLDTGVTAANTWYYVHAIYNGTVKGTLMSLSRTAPTLPSGYTYFAPIGTVYLDGSKNIRGFKKLGGLVQHIVGQNLSNLPQVASGSLGNITTPTWAAVSLTSSVSPAAFAVNGMMSCYNTVGMVAPNNSYGAYTSTTNPPPVVSGSNIYLNTPFTMLLESSSIYFANNGPTYANLSVLGYWENL